MAHATPTYEQTRQAWRDIWDGTEFDQELRSLEYARSQEVLNAYLPLLPDGPVLEAGCGPGHVVYYLQQRGHRAIGLDYAPEALWPTHRRFPDLPLMLGDVHELPYADNSIGAYLSFGVVEHFEHGPLPALQEAYRVLRPEGLLVLTVPAPQIVESAYSLARKLFPERYTRLGKRADYYERTYSHQELAAMTSQAGFRIERVQPIGHAYTFYGVHSIFRKPGSYYETSALAERLAAGCRRVLPWATAFHTLILGRK
jgi:SAM-dependent methyltransferase